MNVEKKNLYNFDVKASLTENIWDGSISLVFGCLIKIRWAGFPKARDCKTLSNSFSGISVSWWISWKVVIIVRSIYYQPLNVVIFKIAIPHMWVYLYYWIATKHTCVMLKLELYVYGLKGRLVSLQCLDRRLLHMHEPQAVHGTPHLNRRCRVAVGEIAVGRSAFPDKIYEIKIHVNDIQCVVGTKHGKISYVHTVGTLQMHSVEQQEEYILGLVVLANSL